MKSHSYQREGHVIGYGDHQASSGRRSMRRCSCSSSDANTSLKTKQTKYIALSVLRM